jgi:hypothetical protein
MAFPEESPAFSVQVIREHGKLGFLQIKGPEEEVSPVSTLGWLICGRQLGGMVEVRDSHGIEVPSEAGAAKLKAPTNPWVVGISLCVPYMLCFYRSWLLDIPLLERHNQQQGGPHGIVRL